MLRPEAWRLAGAAAAGLLLAAPVQAQIGLSAALGLPLGDVASPSMPPVAWYVPPPAYAYPHYGYVPPPAPATPLALACRAGARACMPGQDARPGDACSCPTPHGPAWGRVGG